MASGMAVRSTTAPRLVFTRYEPFGICAMASALMRWFDAPFTAGNGKVGFVGALADAPNQVNELVQTRLGPLAGGMGQALGMPGY
mgnify:CR=1 FL=1